ncbi:MAG: homocysteine S-methyltransferase family protein [Desulfobacterales bacterium]|nr:homocysteine S-methyltransferase family protein [Desulfobacterales bacterium]
MKLAQVLAGREFVLTEAAVDEFFKRSGTVPLHPRLENALFIYDEKARSALADLYHSFIAVARSAEVPFLLCTPTWRANKERLAEADIEQDVNADAVAFAREVKDRWGSWGDHIVVGGMIGCKNDSYRPDQALSTEAAEEFHSWQIERLCAAGVDFLIAATLPSVAEAAGIARAAEKTGLETILSFTIDRDGLILDGTFLSRAFEEIDGICRTPPFGYMINCSYPSFFRSEDEPKSVFSRLIGFQANASSADHSALDEAAERRAEEIPDWGDRMIALNRKYGVKILGGCCGTRVAHLRYLADRLG